MISSHKLFVELLKEDERKFVVEQLRKRSATINLSAKPLPSFYDIPGTALGFLFRDIQVTRLLLGVELVPSTASASVNIGQLEQQLILLLEPRKIKQILIELHDVAERPFWRVNSKVRGHLRNSPLIIDRN